MKKATLDKNGISNEIVELVLRLVDLIPGSDRRCAMGDVTLSLLDGKHRVAENVFGWNRSTVELGINEFKTGITCLNDISLRLNPATEVKHPMLLADIIAIMEPQGESESSLRTTLLYTHMTAKLVYDTLLEKGWRVETLPTVRTISNILNRQGYRLRTVAKTKVQKKRPKPMPYLKISAG